MDINLLGSEELKYELTIRGLPIAGTFAQRRAELRSALRLERSGERENPAVSPYEAASEICLCGAKLYSIERDILNFDQENRESEFKRISTLLEHSRKRIARINATMEPDEILKNELSSKCGFFLKRLQGVYEGDINPSSSSRVNTNREPNVSYDLVELSDNDTVASDHDDNGIDEPLNQVVNDGNLRRLIVPRLSHFVSDLSDDHTNLGRPNSEFENVPHHHQPSRTTASISRDRPLPAYPSLFPRPPVADNNLLYPPEDVQEDARILPPHSNPFSRSHSLLNAPISNIQWKSPRFPNDRAASDEQPRYFQSSALVQPNNNPFSARVTRDRSSVSRPFDGNVDPILQDHPTIRNNRNDRTSRISQFSSSVIMARPLTQKEMEEEVQKILDEQDGAGIDMSDEDFDDSDKDPDYSDELSSEDSDSDEDAPGPSKRCKIKTDSSRSPSPQIPPTPIPGVEILKTGGGDNTKYNMLSPQDVKILSLLQEKYFCVDNVLDSNVAMENNSETENTFFAIPSTSRNFQSCDESLKRPLSLKEEQSQSLLQFQPVKKFKENQKPENVKTVFEEEQSQSLLQFQPVKKFKENQEPENVKTDNVNKKNNKNVKSTNKKPNCYGETISKPSGVSAKKFEVYKNKIKVLHLVQKNEEETFKGIKMDNEIKQIIKEKELLDLEIKKIQYDRLLKEQ
ncbi:unnamed protein product [Ceutorhynchus assimilis]|uniref:Uncharacterized protein n=1 Tax=Ceutorhynchus assimilis TaxID=467358 RepID=A0A9N9MQY6_9CUCU|nr:unnamed protein product [Ceutorhynchus assimilis]